MMEIRDTYYTPLQYRCGKKPFAEKIRVAAVDVEKLAVDDSKDPFCEGLLMNAID